MKIIIVILWVIYAVLEGKRDGYFYHYRNTTRSPQNEDIHWLYMIERFIFMFFAFIFMDQYNILSTLLFISGLAMIFSFFHNGAYYLQRNLLDPHTYPDRWWSSSVSSKATLEFSLIPRLCLFTIGIVSILLSYHV